MEHTGVNYPGKIPVLGESGRELLPQPILSHPTQQHLADVAALPAATAQTPCTAKLDHIPRAGFGRDVEAIQFLGDLMITPAGIPPMMHGLQPSLFGCIGFEQLRDKQTVFGDERFKFLACTEGM